MRNSVTAFITLGFPLLTYVSLYRMGSLKAGLSVHCAWNTGTQSVLGYLGRYQVESGTWQAPSLAPFMGNW